MAIEEHYDLVSLLSSGAKNYLVRKNGDEVKIEDLNGKVVALYFVEAYGNASKQPTLELTEAYETLSPKGEFEVVVVWSGDYEGAFDYHFAKMPFVAVPFSESDTRKRLIHLFGLRVYPKLVILDESGNVLTKDGIATIRSYGADGFPFTSERLDVLREQVEALKKTQTLRSLLVSESRDYVISKDGNQTPVSELEYEYMVALYFTVDMDECHDFTRKLLQFYEHEKDVWHKIEIVWIPIYDDEKSYNSSFSKMPWMGLHYKDEACRKLLRYFSVSVPELVVIGQDGKTVCTKGVELIEDHEHLAYPFTEEQIAEVTRIEKATLEETELPGNLQREDHNFLINRSGEWFHARELAGKSIILYFGQENCRYSSAFFPKLLEMYDEIKAKDAAFEVVYVSSEPDKPAFEHYFAQMPWLALHYGDKREKLMRLRHNIYGYPAAIPYDSEGWAVSEELHVVVFYGICAYPFTKEHIEELEKAYDKTAEKWPNSLYHQLHKEHDLTKTRLSGWYCDDCDQIGYAWGYYCAECNFVLHPKCALPKRTKKEDEPTEDHDLPDTETGIESILVHEDRDFVINSSGDKVPVSELVGKTILLYITCDQIPVCRSFMPRVMEAYHDMKAKNDAFEVVMVSYNQPDQSSFDEHISSVPWLAVPFQDPREETLNKRFNNPSYPSIMVIHPDGRVVSKESHLIVAYGVADSYPFTEHRFRQIDQEIKMVAQGFPRKLRHPLHICHEVYGTPQNGYICDGCGDLGYGWSFYCEECMFDLHPMCALYSADDVIQFDVDVPQRRYRPGWRRSVKKKVLTSNNS